MATYVLIHGASSDSWYWHLVVPKLQALGHDVVAPDLPVSDDSAGLAEYTDTVVDAIGDRTDVILVAQSMAGFTAPMVSERVPVDLIVMVAAMVPAPGESPGDWWANTGQSQDRRVQDERDGRDPDAEFDPMVVFLHDLPPDVLEAAMAQGVPRQSDTPFEKPWPPARGRRAPPGSCCAGRAPSSPPTSAAPSSPSWLGITPDDEERGQPPARAQPRARAGPRAVTRPPLIRSPAEHYRRRLRSRTYCAAARAPKTTARIAIHLIAVTMMPITRKPMAKTARATIICIPQVYQYSLRRVGGRNTFEVTGLLTRPPSRADQRARAA